MRMTDDQINAVVARVSRDIVDACGHDPDAVLCAVFGVVGHCVICFGIPNETAHEALAQLLKQRRDHG